jgi:hypothetical protein
MRKLGFLLFLYFLCSAVPAEAKDLYFAAQQATTGTGSGCSTAKAISWLSSTLNWGTGSAQVGPGTVVHLCGTFNGTAGQQLLVVRYNGTATAPITIKFETNAILSAPFWSSQGAINAQGRSYIVIDGGTNGLIKNTANGTGLGNAQDSRAIFVSACISCTVKNLTIANMYVRTAVTDLAVRQTAVNCVYFINSDNLIVTHITCHDAGWALAGYGNNFTLSYSNLYNVDHGLAFGPSGTSSGFSIHDNHIHDYVKWDSTTNAYHHDGLHLWGQQGGIVTNGVIYNNVFDGDSGVNITGHIYLQDSVRYVSVYNNVFLVPSNRTIQALWFNGITNGLLPGGPATGNSAYNNFIRAGGHVHGSAIFAMAQNSFTAVNNVLLGGNSDIAVQGGGSFSSLGVNNNIYEDIYADAGSLNAFSYQGRTYHDIATWRAACHCDSNSKLVPASQINANSLGQLLPGSLAISAAANLLNMTTGNLASLSKDKVGAVRQSSGNWDAGAYKFGSIAPPSSPTGLTATVQ